MSLPVDYKCDDAFETRLSKILFRDYPHGLHHGSFHLLARQFIEKLVHILVEILLFAGISCGMDSGSASENIDFKTCVIRKTVGMDTVPDIVGFLLRIGPQGSACLGNILLDSHLCRGNELKSLA